MPKVSIVGNQKIIEKAIVFACNNFATLKDQDKPVLFHGIRVGSRLYFDSYPTQIVIAGYLHDIVEDTKVTTVQLEKHFGKTVKELVLANTKKSEITNRAKRHDELIHRCVSHNESAAIVKAADILDNFDYYSKLGDERGIAFCKNNAKLFKKYFVVTYKDPIFDELFSILTQSCKC